MSIINGRSAIKPGGRWAESVREKSRTQEREGLAKNGPVTTQQGPSRGGKRVKWATTCRWCWEALEAGAMYRWRREITGHLIMTHVSCTRGSKSTCATE